MIDGLWWASGVQPSSTHHTRSFSGSGGSDYASVLCPYRAPELFQEKCSVYNEVTSYNSLLPRDKFLCNPYYSLIAFHLEAEGLISFISVYSMSTTVQSSLNNIYIKKK